MVGKDNTIDADKNNIYITCINKIALISKDGFFIHKQEENYNKCAAHGTATYLLRLHCYISQQAAYLGSAHSFYSMYI